MILFQLKNDDKDKNNHNHNDNDNDNDDDASVVRNDVALGLLAMAVICRSFRIQRRGPPRWLGGSTARTCIFICGMEVERFFPRKPDRCLPALDGRLNTANVIFHGGSGQPSRNGLLISEGEQVYFVRFRKRFLFLLF